MNKFLFFLFMILVSRFGASSVPCEGYAELVDKLIPAVVNVSTEQKINNEPRRGRSFGGSPFFEEFREFFERMEPFMEKPPASREIISLGSGFIIDEAGLIVTNHHVIANAKEVTVTLSDNSQFKATILGQDSKTDLAILKINAGKSLPYVKFGDSDKMRVGDSVIAIGNPFGLGGSVSAGIVSARSRDINIGTVGDFIQTDAAINRGNSGGPLFNINGEVIGINAAIFSPSGGNVGIGFAIPSNSAAPVISVLETGKKIEHGWMGVKVQVVTKDVSDSLGLKEVYGALVAEVTKNSPADKSGLKSGDVIIEFDGTKISKMQQLLQLVSRAQIDKPVKMRVYRNGKQEELVIKIGKLQDTDLEESEEVENIKSSAGDALGLKLVELSQDIRTNNEIDEDINGLYVVKVDSNSDAFVKGIRRGDVISGVNQNSITNLNELNKIINLAKKEKRGSVLLLVNRGNSGLYISVKLTTNNNSSNDK